MQEQSSNDMPCEILFEEELCEMHADMYQNCCHINLE